MHGSNELFHVLDAMTFDVVFDIVDCLDGHLWVDKVGCANLHCCGSCKHEFYHITAIHDASQPYHRHFHSLCHTMRTAMGLMQAPDNPPVVVER